MKDAFISVSWAPTLVLLHDLGQVMTLLGSFSSPVQKRLESPRFPSLDLGVGAGLVGLTHVSAPQSAECFCSLHFPSPLSPYPGPEREGGSPYCPLGRIDWPGLEEAPKRPGNSRLGVAADGALNNE